MLGFVLFKTVHQASVELDSFIALMTTLLGWHVVKHFLQLPMHTRA